MIVVGSRHIGSLLGDIIAGEAVCDARLSPSAFANDQ